MQYKFYAYGHHNMQATHKTTLEFTKDKELSLKGDCIVGVNADFKLDKLKGFIKNCKNKKITIMIKALDKKIEEKFLAELNPYFNSNKEFVIRKTNFISDRTFAINSNKASFDLNKHLIDFLKENKNRISVILQNKE